KDRRDLLPRFDGSRLVNDVVGRILHRLGDGAVGFGRPQAIGLVAVDHPLGGLDIFGRDLTDFEVDPLGHSIGEEYARQRNKNHSRQPPLADSGLAKRIDSPAPKVLAQGLHPLHPLVTSTAAPSPDHSSGGAPFSPPPPSFRGPTLPGEAAGAALAAAS